MLPENSEYVEMLHNMMTSPKYNSFRFYPSHGLLKGMDFSQMGKNSGKQNLVC